MLLRLVSRSAVAWALIKVSYLYKYVGLFV